MPIWFSFVVWKCCFTFIFIFFASVFCLHVCICSICFLDIHWGEKKASDPLRLVLWTAVSLPESAGHRLQVLWNSNKCSQPPSQISSPRSGIWVAEVGLLVSGSHSQFGSKALSLGRQLKGKADRVNRSPIVLRDRESFVGSLNWLTGILDEVAGNQHFQLGHQSALCFRDKRLTSYHFLKGQAEFL